MSNVYGFLPSFIRNALRTKSDVLHTGQFENDPKMADILHAAFGFVTESGEVLDGLKKSIFYGKKIDLVNLDEEVGDIMWYIAIYCKARADMINREKPVEAAPVTAEEVFDEICTRVINKLQIRFPEKFTTYAAENRDLFAERKALEG